VRWQDSGDRLMASPSSPVSDPRPPLVRDAMWLRTFDALREELLQEVAPNLVHSPFGIAGAEIELDECRQRIATLQELGEPTGMRGAVASAPIIVCGLPRTGTTLLQHLLEGAGAGLSPRPFHVYAPSATASTAATREACEAAGQRVALIEALSPRLFGLHPFGVDLPEECTPVLASTLVSLQTSFMFRCPRFTSLVLDHDGSFSYAVWARYVRHLYGQLGCSLVLKSPMHVGHYDRILEAFPGARLVQVRRPVEDVLLSVLNLVEQARSVLAGQVDPIALGEEWLALLGQVLAKGEQSALTVASRVTTIDYDKLRASPGAVLRGLGMEWELPPLDLDTCASIARRTAALHTSKLRPLWYYGLSVNDIRTALAPRLQGTLVA
jgi:hypothetical protein